MKNLNAMHSRDAPEVAEPAANPWADIFGEVMKKKVILAREEVDELPDATARRKKRAVNKE